MVTSPRVVGMDRTDPQAERQSPQHPDPQPGPHFYAPPRPDLPYPDPWPWFWPDGTRAAPGVCPTRDESWRLGRDVLPSGTVVSTVFLGLDHAYLGDGPPVLWETMTFPRDGGADGMARYASRAAAVEGHTAAVLLVTSQEGADVDAGEV